MSTDDEKPEEVDPRDKLPYVSPLDCAVLTLRELGKTRRALERIADAQELQAVLHTQISVPDHVGAKLDAWRDEVLARMAARYQRRATRTARAAARPNGAPAPASPSSVPTDPAPGDSHPTAADAVSTPQG